jgi:biopolymer transport protein ExbB
MQSAQSFRQTTLFIAVLMVIFGMTSSAHRIAGAQEAPVNMAVGDDEIDNGNQPASDASSTEQPPTGEFNLLRLLLQSGVLMVPIYATSILVVTLVIERGLSLRKRKILPKELVGELGRLAAHHDGFDPRRAYRLCQKFPSSASTVIRAMLLKVGRPLAEVERAVAEVSDREAARLYSNVRWLNLAAAVAPLMGLFGTVWGMIWAFYRTTQLQAGQNKADFLAEGIYIALVTTLGGLAVAIPAAIFSHYFEGRIQNLFYSIDELLFNLMPQIERYEGRLRMNRQTLSEDSEEVEDVEPPATAPEPPRRSTQAPTPTQ